MAYERPLQSAVIKEAVVEANEPPTTKAASPEEVYIKAHAEEAAKAVHEGLSPSQRMSAILEGMSMQVRPFLHHGVIFSSSLFENGRQINYAKSLSRIGLALEQA